MLALSLGSKLAVILLVAVALFVYVVNGIGDSKAGVNKK